MIYYGHRNDLLGTFKEIESAKAQLQSQLPKMKAAWVDTVKTFFHNVDSLKLGDLNQKFHILFDGMQNADAQPTQRCLDAVKLNDDKYLAAWKKWETLKKELGPINEELKKEKLQAVK